VIIEGTAGPAGEVRAGQLNGVIANEIGKLTADFTGRGSGRSRTFITGDVVACLRENGVTRGERNVAVAGRADAVRVARVMLQHAMEDRLVAVVERLTGRKVRSFLCGSSTPGKSAVEVVVLEPGHGGRRRLCLWQGSGTSPLKRLRERFPAVIGPRTDDIATRPPTRQAAVRQLARQCELVLVVGSRNSSNSNRLVEVAREHGADSYLIDDEGQVRDEWLNGTRVVGITSGASAPEELVKRLVEYFQARGTSDVQELEVVQEDVRFMLPKAIRQAVAGTA
jgi:uncharacterized protein YbcI